MKPQLPPTPAHPESPVDVDRLGQALARPLQQRADELPEDITTRLAQARAAALEAARAQAEAVQEVGNGQLALQGGPRRRGGRLAGFWLPLLVVAAGVIALAQAQWVQRLVGLGEVDASLLQDDLPIEAYGDPGFREFLDEEQAKERKPEDEEQDDR